MIFKYICITQKFNLFVKHLYIKLSYSSILYFILLYSIKLLINNNTNEGTLVLIIYGKVIIDFIIKNDKLGI